MYALIRLGRHYRRGGGEANIFDWNDYKLIFFHVTLKVREYVNPKYCNVEEEEKVDTYFGQNDVCKTK